MKNILLWIARLLFAAVFIFSGFVKAIDPIGTAYKLQDYFLAFGIDWLFPIALPMSIAMNALEFIIGIAVLLGLKMKYTAWFALMFMLFFTPLTLYIALTDPVPDCGCFGDAIIVSNWATFYKNLIFLTAAILIFIKRNTIKALLDEKRDWYVLGIISVFTLWLSVYCLRNLPIIDFRPWKTGNNVVELMQETKPAVLDISFVYINNETGEKTEVSQEDIMAGNVPETPKWRFVSRNEKIIEAGIPPKIENFTIIDDLGYDHTETYLHNPDYLFIVIAYDLIKTRKKAFVKKINPLAVEAEKNNYSLIVLTGNSFEDIDAFRHKHQTSYPFYQSDDIELKTIIRSNPGLLLMKNGVVISKWAHRNIPSFDRINKKYMRK